MEPSGCACPVAMTIAAMTSSMTAVRISVAKSELTFSTPTLAKMAVRAAKPAESSAQNCHEEKERFMRCPAVLWAAILDRRPAKGKSSELRSDTPSIIQIVLCAAVWAHDDLEQRA